MRSGIYNSGYYTTFGEYGELKKEFYSHEIENQFLLSFVNNADVIAKGYDIVRYTFLDDGFVVFTTKKMTESEYLRVVKKEEIEKL